MAWMPSGILQGAEKVSNALHSVNGGEHFPIRGDAYFKAAIHVASGADIDPGDVPAVKIFEAGGCAVRNVFPGGKKRVQCLFFIRTSFEPEAGREGQSIRQHSEDGFLHSHGIQVKHCMDHPREKGCQEA